MAEENTSAGELLRELRTRYKAVEFHGNVYIGRLPGRSDTAGEILDTDLNVVAGPFESIVPVISGRSGSLEFKGCAVHANDGLDMSKMRVTGFVVQNYLGVQERVEDGEKDTWDLYETIRLSSSGKELSRKTHTLGAPYSIKNKASSGK